MFKPCLLALALFSGFTFATDALPSTPMMGDITKAQFMERAEQRFALQDKNGDGVLSVAEKEDSLAKIEGVMKQAGKPMPERMAQLKPRRDTTKAQFMARQEKIFERLDKNGDGVIGESERAEIKANLEKRAMEAAQ
ncbi:MAG: EF-hand domain-containing protein [Aeromonas sp.]|uniref:EF-hand domain-containing protein n=1 Tax=Aeromonas sp. TaxID=647 RepID=UPI003F2E2A1C